MVLLKRSERRTTMYAISNLDRVRHAHGKTGTVVRVVSTVGDDAIRTQVLALFDDGTEALVHPYAIPFLVRAEEERTWRVLPFSGCAVPEDHPFKRYASRVVDWVDISATEAYAITQESPGAGYRWTIFWVNPRGQATVWRTSDGCFYDVEDHPEGALQWARDALAEWLAKVDAWTTLPDSDEDVCLNCRQPRGFPAHKNPEGFCRNSTRQFDRAAHAIELMRKKLEVVCTVRVRTANQPCAHGRSDMCCGNGAPPRCCPRYA
jgi:hypothetical protein